MKPLKKWTAILLILLLFIVGPVAASTTFTSSGPQTLAKGDSFMITGTFGTDAGGAPLPVIIGGAVLLGIGALFVLSQRRKT